ncbi:heavy metal-associated domain-containing protein [Bacillus licheniformis]|nr:heavy metal-associated domain-containing protein [Bacillus licheniformis]
MRLAPTGLKAPQQAVWRQSAAVNFAIETATVDYHAGAVSPEEMIEAVESSATSSS